MDASVYFRLSDRIDAARSLSELAAIRDDIDSVAPHAMERRALERRIERRERVLLLPLVAADMSSTLAQPPLAG
jgi:hypothetical protein